MLDNVAATAEGHWRCELSEPRGDVFAEPDTVWCVTLGYADEEFARAELAFPADQSVTGLSC